MFSWGRFAQAAPELAALGRERFERTGLVLVGTIRRDGSPRISPVEPLIVGEQLYLGMMWQSRKGLDLKRDPRCLVHNTVTSRDGTDGEFKLRGLAVDVADHEERERYATALEAKIDWRPEEPYFLFALDIAGAAFLEYVQEKQRVRRWDRHRGEH